jgi:hypothetical protein
MPLAVAHASIFAISSGEKLASPKELILAVSKDLELIGVGFFML